MPQKHHREPSELQDQVPCRISVAYLIEKEPILNSFSCLCHLVMWATLTVWPDLLILQDIRADRTQTELHASFVILYHFLSFFFFLPIIHLPCLLIF